MAERIKDDGCRAYREIEFTEERAQLVGWVRSVVQEYGRDGMQITVRQVYYQAVARGYRPSGDKTYNAIQGALNDGRLAGLIPWTLVEDRGRGIRGLPTWEHPVAALKDARRRYLIDCWVGQPYRPEVWVEKQALEGVVGDICTPLRVDFYATKGYDSQSQQWAAGQRLADYIRRGQRPIIFYLGDHDPSGLHMGQDVGKRLEMFTGTPVIVQRLALTMSQIEQYNPPPFAVKEKDPRAPAYRALHGDTAWELDALDPRALKDIVTRAVEAVRDPVLWEAALAEEVGDHRELDELIENYGGVKP